MFIRIIQNGGQLEKLIDCTQYQMADGPEPETAILTVDPNHPTRRCDLELIKDHTEVYVMNDDGKTIDSYPWNLPKN